MRTLPARSCRLAGIVAPLVALVATADARAHSLSSLAARLHGGVAATIGATLTQPRDDGAAGGGGGGGGGGVTLSTDLDALAWSLVAVLVVAVLVGLAGRLQRSARAALVLVAGAGLASLGAPLHLVGVAMLLGLVASVRPHAAAPAAAAAVVALASLTDVVVDFLARVDAALVGAVLPWLGTGAITRGVEVAIGPHAIVVDPACAAVEGIVVAFAASVALRALNGAAPGRTLALATLHALVFAGANVVRIGAVGFALAASPDTAMWVHDVGGPLLALVHVPFLVPPLRSLLRTLRWSSSSFAGASVAGAGGAA
jgi:exosortase/archaeosortase family protein